MDFNGIILLAGGRGAGKSTVANILNDRYGLKILPSHTTRKPRYASETGHIFDTNEEFDKIPKEDIVAYSEHYGDRYCATKDQVEDCDIYVIDMDGIRYFKEAYTGPKSVHTVYLVVSEEDREERLNSRGDNPEAIGAFLKKDRDADIEAIYSGLVDLVIINKDLENSIKLIDMIILEPNSKLTHIN